MMNTMLSMVALCALLFSAPVRADDDHKHSAATRAGDVEVTRAWARATAATAQAGAAYFAIVTSGTAPDRLVAVATEVAEKAELHTHILDGGVARMRPVDGIEVSPGSPTVLAPGGLHVMLMGLKEPLVKGKEFKMTLTFATAGKLEVPVKVLGPGDGGEHRHEGNERHHD